MEILRAALGLLLLAVCLLQVGCTSELNNSIPDPPLDISQGQRDNQQKAEEPGIVRDQFQHPPIDEVIRSASQYLLSRRDPSTYGWGQETHRAITTLALTQALSPQNQQDNEQKLMIKELELKLAVALAKQHQQNIPPGQLALYVNALLAICQNPRDFYGLNLVAKLYHDNTVQLSYSYSLQSLALCNAGAAYSKDRLLQLIEYVKIDPSQHGGFIDNLAMTTLALACGQKYHPMMPAERYLSQAVKTVKKAQRVDGSFGNIYSSALALQALTFAETNDKNWNRTLAREYILSQRKEDGSFQDFMGTYFALPLLTNRTFGSLANWSCGSVEPTQDPGDSVITNSPENNRTKISVSLLVRAQEIQEYRVALKGYQEDNLYTILTSNEESISVEFTGNAYGHMIVGVDGLYEDPRNMKYWLIYIVDKDGKESFAPAGVDGIFPENGEKFVFELKTFEGTR